jgi:plastocyanin
MSHNISVTTVARRASALALGLVALNALFLGGCDRRITIDPQVDFSNPEIEKVVDSIRSGGESSGSEEGAAASTGTGWGGLKGQFTMAGDVPTLAPISTGGKDADMCGDRVPDQSLIVDPASKGISNIVVFARKVSRVKDETVPSDEALFDQKACLFLTHVLTVRTGQPVKILNSDPKAHNTAGNPPGDAGFNPQLPGGGSTTVSFKKSQNAPFPVTCSIHPWMKAFMFPRSDSYVAVSGPDGTFEIKDLPAGENIEFMVWHEKVGGGSGGGLAAKSGWNGGRFKLTIPADGVEDLGVIEVPATAFQ